MRFRLAAFLILAACHAEPVAPVVTQPTTMAGRYVLQGTPVLLSFIAGEWYGYTSGVVWLHEDSTFADTAVTDTYQAPLPAHNVQTWADAGRWRADTMPISHDTLTRFVHRGPIGLPDVTLRYVRQ